MARPCKPDSRWLLRPLTPAHRAILLAAGQGDLSKGWETVLDVYAQLHNAGYRHGQGNHPVGFLMNPDNESES